MLRDQDEYDYTHLLRSAWTLTLRRLDVQHTLIDADAVVRASLVRQIETFDEELRRYEAGERPRAEEDAAVPVLLPLPPRTP